MIDPMHTLADIQTEGCWDLSDLFKDHRAWGAELAWLEADLPRCETFRGRLTQPLALLDYLEWDNDYTARYLRLDRYVFFQNPAGGDPAGTSHLEAQLKAFWLRWAQASDFVEYEIRQINEQLLEDAYRSEPRLLGWKTYLANLRQHSPHSLSEPEESLLAQLSVPLDLTRRMTDLLIAELQIPKVATSAGVLLEVNLERMSILYRHPERGVREQARARAFEELIKHRKTFARTLHTSVSRLVTLARVRGFHSSLAAALEPEGMDEVTFRTVIAAFERNHGVWQRCFEARKALLELSQLRPFDLLAGISDGLQGIAFETAVEWICAALEPMGERYVQTLRDGLTKNQWVRWSDDGRAINADMAYATYGASPRVQVFYDGSLRSVSLLAHEIGHAMHYWHFGRAQPFHYAHSSRLMAESVANFHQAILRSHLLSAFTDERMQRAVIDEELEFYQNYYFAKPITSKLEYLIHERIWNDSPLTSDWLDETTLRVYEEAYGRTIQSDDCVSAQWIGLSSLENNFYNFQYLPGFAVGANLAARLLAGELTPQTMISLLEVGTSVSLNDGLSRVAINLSDPQLLESGFGALDSLTARLRQWS